MNLVIGPVAASAIADRPDVDISIETSEIEVEVNPSDMGITIMPPVAREIVGADVYDGEYALTPSQQAQQLQTSGKLLTAFMDSQSRHPAASMSTADITATILSR